MATLTRFPKRTPDTSVSPSIPRTLSQEEIERICKALIKLLDAPLIKKQGVQEHAY